MVATLTSLKLEPKLLSSRVMELYKDFHLTKPWGVNQTASECVPKKVMQMGYKKGFFPLYFRHLLRHLKNFKIYYVLH